MNLAPILNRLAHHFWRLSLNILVLVLYFCSWLFLLMTLFSLSLDFDELLNPFLYAISCGLLFSLALYLRRYLRRVKSLTGSNTGWPALAGYTFMILLTGFVLYLKFTLFPEDMRTLAKQRRDIIEQQIIPAAHVYWQEHGSYPPSLEALVPDYLSAMPKELVNSYYPKRAYQIIYAPGSQGQGASIRYRDCMGPDCGATIDLATGEYRHDL